MAHAGGRPSEYDPKYCDEIVKFFEVEPFERKTGIDANGVIVERYQTNTFPTLERFASKIGVVAITLRHWAEERDSEGNLVRPEFFHAYSRARDLQAANMIEGGMAGTYSGAFTVLAAKNLIAWRDKQELTGANGDPLVPAATTITVVRPPKRDA
jgi:hypothetical protein